MFILVISHWNKLEKQAYDKRWGIPERYTLSKYLSLNESWKENALSMFKKFEGTKLTQIDLIVQNPILQITIFIL